MPNFKTWPGVKGAASAGTCVLAEVGKANDTKLWWADCEEKNYFVCEVFISQDFINFCACELSELNILKIITDDKPGCEKAVGFFMGSAEEVTK
jgi:hypothetical protein